MLDDGGLGELALVRATALASRLEDGQRGPMKRWFQFLDWPLRGKMAALLVVVSLLPLTLTAVHDIRRARQRLTETTAALLAARGDQLAGELDTFHRGYQRSTRSMTRLPQVLTLLQGGAADATSTGSVLAVLRAKPDSDPNVRGVGVLDATGKVVVATEAPLVGKNMAYRGYIEAARSAAGAVVSDVYLAEPEVGREATIAYVMPVLDAVRRPLGFVALWVRAAALWDLAKGSNALAGPDSFAVLLDHAGIRIAHTAGRDIVFSPAGVLDPGTFDAMLAEQRFGAETSERLSQVVPFPEQFQIARSTSPNRGMFRGLAHPNGRYCFGVGRRLESVPWTVFYMVPEVALNGELTSMTRERALFALGTMLIALLAGAGFVALVSRPLVSLASVTESFSLGNATARVRSARRDEAGRLAASFDAMADRLQQQAESLQRANESLELKVQERTAQLAEAAHALRESEESLATTLHSIGDAVIATDTEGSVTRMNPIAEQLTGWTFAEARGKPLNDVLHLVDEASRQRIESPVQQVLREGGVVGLANHTLLLTRDGGARPIADSGAPIRDAQGALRGVVLVFRDQTDERKIEQALRESAERKGAIMAAALDGIVGMDHLGSITEFNPAAEQIFGYSRAQAIGKSLAELLIPAELRQRHTEGLERYLLTGSGPILGKRLELSALRADGTRFPAELAVVAHQLNQMPSFTAYIRDISERRRAAEALSVSEARFQHLYESGIIGIIITDTRGEIHEANDAFLRIVGYSRAELSSGMVNWAALTPPEWQHLDAKAVRELETTGVAQPWEKEYLRRDRSRAHVLVGVTMLEAPRGIAFVLDLTQQKRAEEIGALAVAAAEHESVNRVRVEQQLRQTEEQLRQSQKMEAIGRLAGSISHDFNNLLSVILSYGELLMQDLRAADPMHTELEQIVRAGRRAHELTRQLLAFSRQQVLQPRVLNLNDALSGMTRMIGRLIGEDIELSVQPGANLGAVRVDPGQMEQVLLNLIVNARDAMPQGGRLTIETSDIALDSAYASEHLDVEPGNYVMLSVSDTGLGMDRATQERIFEPFFTTKDRGKGTGLGLSTVFGIIKQSGGAVWVYSEPGKGSSFKVYLPRVDAAAGSPSSNPRPISTMRGVETILLAEDDEQVRKLASMILAKHGYHVLEAATGGDALLICEQYEATIHLLLTDVIMPRMSGRELWERLAPLRPEMTVLFMSGYTDDAIVHHGVLSSELAFVQKPLMPNTLLSKLREVLDGKASSAPRDASPKAAG